MPKITRENGPSDAAADVDTGTVPVSSEPVETESSAERSDTSSDRPDPRHADLEGPEDRSTSLTDLSVTDLRSACRSRGLSTSGDREALVSRLREDDAGLS